MQISVQRSVISYQPTPNWPIFFRLLSVPVLSGRHDLGLLNSLDYKQLAREVTEVKRMLTPFVQKLMAERLPELQDAGWQGQALQGAMGGGDVALAAMEG